MIPSRIDTLYYEPLLVRPWSRKEGKFKKLRGWVHTLEYPEAIYLELSRSSDGDMTAEKIAAYDGGIACHMAVESAEKLGQALLKAVEHVKGIERRKGSDRRHASTKK